MGSSKPSQATPWSAVVAFARAKNASPAPIPPLLSLHTTMRLAVFDLDYTIWQPEMYQLAGPPKLIPAKRYAKTLSPALWQETRTNTEGHILVDPYNSPMRVFDGA